MFNFNKLFEDIGKSTDVATHNPESGERDSLKLNESEMRTEDDVEDLLAEFEKKFEAKKNIRIGRDEYDADEVADPYTSNMEDEILDKIDREAAGDDSEEFQELKAKYGEMNEEEVLDNKTEEPWKPKYVEITAGQKKEWLKMIVKKIYDTNFVDFKKISKAEKDRIFTLLNEIIRDYINRERDKQIVAEGKKGLAKKRKDDAEWEKKLAAKDASKKRAIRA